MVEEDVASFALDRAVSNEKAAEVVAKSIEKLLRRDDPALELIKMQVDFDSTYSKENIEAQRKLKARNKMIASHKVSIGKLVSTACI